MSYSPAEKQLLYSLNLVCEFWTGCTLTGDQEPPAQHLAAYRDWIKCQEIRRQLLKAVEELERPR